MAVLEVYDDEHGQEGDVRAAPSPPSTTAIATPAVIQKGRPTTT